MLFMKMVAEITFKLGKGEGGGGGTIFNPLQFCELMH